MRLEKCDDPACPACGCTDCPELVGGDGGLRWGTRYEDGRPATTSPDDQPARPVRRCCAHCRRVFYVVADAPANDEVLHAVLRCPHCNSARHHVTRTIARSWTRYHKCDDCSLTFKSRSV